MHSSSLKDWKSRTMSPGPCKSLHSSHARSSEEERQTEGDKEEAEEGKEAPLRIVWKQERWDEKRPPHLRSNATSVCSLYL